MGNATGVQHTLTKETSALNNIFPQVLILLLQVLCYLNELIPKPIKITYTVSRFTRGEKMQ